MQKVNNVIVECNDKLNKTYWQFLDHINDTTVLISILQQSVFHFQLVVTRPFFGK